MATGGKYMGKRPHIYVNYGRNLPNTADEEENNPNLYFTLDEIFGQIPPRPTNFEQHPAEVTGMNSPVNDNQEFANQQNPSHIHNPKPRSRTVQQHFPPHQQQEQIQKYLIKHFPFDIGQSSSSSAAGVPVPVPGHDHYQKIVHPQNPSQIYNPLEESTKILQHFPQQQKRQRQQHLGHYSAPKKGSSSSALGFTVLGHGEIINFGGADTPKKIISFQEPKPQKSIQTEETKKGLKMTDIEAKTNPVHFNFNGPDLKKLADELVETNENLDELNKKNRDLELRLNNFTNFEKTSANNLNLMKTLEERRIHLTNEKTKLEKEIEITKNHIKQIGKQIQESIDAAEMRIVGKGKH